VEEERKKKISMICLKIEEKIMLKLKELALKSSQRDLMESLTKQRECKNFLEIKFMQTKFGKR
jgi:hypothetical protein